MLEGSIRTRLDDHFNFGSTYNCEPFLSNMKHCKGKRRNQFSDQHLMGQRGVACSFMKENVPKLCEDLQHHASH